MATGRGPDNAGGQEPVAAHRSHPRAASFRPPGATLADEGCGDNATREHARYPHAETMVDQESPAGERQPRKRGRRRLVRGCLAPALIGLLLLALAVLFRGAWLEPLARRLLVGYARRELGAELTIERISGNWLDALTLEGVRWRGPPPLVAVERATVELGFSLQGLRHGAPELTLRIRGEGIGLELTSAPDESTSAPRSAGGDLSALDLPCVELDLARIVLRRVGAEELRLDALHTKGALGGSKLGLESLEITSGSNRVTLSQAELDLAANEGTAGATEAGFALARSLRGTLGLELADAAFVSDLAGRPLPLRSAVLALQAEGGRASVTGRVELVGGSIGIERGELALPVHDDLADVQLALGLQATFTDLAGLSALAGQPLAGRWSGSIEVQGPLRAPTGRFDGHGDGLEIGELALGAFDIDVRTDGQSARFERCELSNNDLDAVLRGEVRFHPLELVDLGLNVFADNGSLSPFVSFPIAQAFVHARLSGPPTALSGDFEASAMGVELGGLQLDDAQARGHLEREVLDVAQLRVTSGASSIEAAGRVQRTGAGVTATLEALRLAWQGTRVELERGARIAWAPGHLSVEDAALRSTSGGAEGRATIALHQDEGSTRAALEFERYEAGALLAPFLPSGMEAGRISGHVRGTLGDEPGDPAGPTPALALDLALERWRLDPAWPPFALTLRGDFDGHELALEHVELGFEEDEAVRVGGTLRMPLDVAHPLALAEGPVALRVELATRDAVRSLRRAGIEPGLSSTGPFSASLDLAGTWRALRGGLGLEAEDITMGTEAGARACDLEARLAFGEETRIERAVFSAPSGSITLSGGLAPALDVPGWLEEPRLVAEAPLTLAARVDLADIGWIAGLSSELRRVSGQVAGNLGIGGNLFRPQLSGGLAWEGGELRLTSSSAPLRNLAARLAFEGEVVRVESLSGEVGGAPVLVTGTVEPFGPFRRLDLALSGKSLLLARSSDLRLRADADLIVKGTPSQLAIRGELTLVEGLYTTEISPLDELLSVGKRSQPSRPLHLELWSDGPLASSELDVHLGGTRTFEYRSNLLEASLRPDAYLRGTGAFPVLEGPVYIEEAGLKLPPGELKLTSGLLTFRREAPLRPDMALKAEMRVQRHDVRVVATGPLDDPKMVLSSSPPMANDDLWVLVLTGQLPTGRWQDRSSQAMEALAVFLARDSLVRWFASEPDDAESLLDRFEIDVGAKASVSGQPTGRALFYLRPHTRRSGRATYLSAEIDEYDNVNYAFGIVFRPR